MRSYNHLIVKVRELAEAVSMDLDSDEWLADESAEADFIRKYPRIYAAIAALQEELK